MKKGDYEYGFDANGEFMILHNGKRRINLTTFEAIVIISIIGILLASIILWLISSGNIVYIAIGIIK